MNYLDTVLAGICKLIFVGGGAAAITFGLLKAFGTSWLDTYFHKRKKEFEHEQNVAIAELKRTHDQNLKEVQALIDKDMHRARKRYDKEFEVLGQAWTLLFKAFDTTHSTLVSWVVRVDEMDDKTRNRFFEQEKFEHWQIDQVMALQGEAMVDKVTEIRNRIRHRDYTEYRMEFARYLAVNGVFMPTGFKTKFEVIDAMVNSALVEFKLRLDYTEYASNTDALLKLAEKGKPLLDELETQIHERIWADRA
jgi:hypothetical protein